MNLSEHQLRVLQKIVSIFKKNNITNNWIIAGGIAHKINGIDIETKDIDILTTTHLAFEMNQVLKNYSISEVKIGGNEKFHSAFGQFEIDGMLVEIAGDLLIKGVFQYPLSVTEDMLKNSTKININNYDVNIEPLEESLIADSLLGRSTRVEKIVDKLKENGIDWQYINNRLSRIENVDNFMEVLHGYF